MTTTVKSGEIDVEAFRAMLAGSEPGGFPAERVVELLDEVGHLRAEEAKRVPASAAARAKLRAAMDNVKELCETVLRERNQALDDLEDLQAHHKQLQKQFDELTAQYNRLDGSFVGLADVFIEEGITQEGLGQLEERLSERMTRIREGLAALKAASGKLESAGITVCRSRGVAVSGLDWEDVPDLYGTSARVREAYEVFDAIILEELEKATSVSSPSKVQ
jgi:vacuolar-type H+-ATPase subunit I/STV1